MNTKTLSQKVYVATWAALISAFLLTWGLARIDLGVFNVVIALFIAFCQTLLVILYFMHVRYSTRLTWLFVAAGFYWVGVIFVLGLADYISRGWLGPETR
jgi:cytochrome c oxidase subunit 4